MTQDQWVAIAPSVAVELWGPPSRKGEREIRWGRKGSKSMKIDTGRWYDFEEDRGGGVIDLVQLELNLDKAGAAEWLKREGYLPRRNPGRFKGRSKNPIRRHVAGGERQSRLPKPKPVAEKKDTESFARKLWAESVFISDDAEHPFRKWTSQRNLLHPWCSVPYGIRWHSRRRIIVCGVFPLSAWRTEGKAEGIPVAVHLLAIDRDGNKRFIYGEQKDRDKNSLGPLSEGVFILGNPHSDRVNIVEGVADALAVYSRESGAVLATLGTSKTLPNKPDVIDWLIKKNLWLYPDNDENSTGEEGTAVLIDIIKTKSPDAKVIKVSARTFGDPGEWAERTPFRVIERYDFDERSGIFFENGLPWGEADRMAIQILRRRNSK